MPGMKQTQEARLIMSVRKSLIHGVYTICMGTSGNGCRIIGMTITLVHLQMEVPGTVGVALVGLSAAWAGTAPPGGAGRLYATPTTPVSATPAMVFAF